MQQDEKSHKRKVVVKDDKITGYVYVEENGPAGDYILWLHEGLYDLGEISLRKQGSQSKVVGRKFMERMFEEDLPLLLKWRAKKIKDKFK